MDKKYYVFNQCRQSFLHLGVARADTSIRRLRGLLGRWSLRSNEGLWVIPSRGIHTIGLFFPIDVVYLDESCRVVHLVESLKPFRIAPILMHCASVLELPTRSIYSSNTQIGDQLLILTPEQMQAQWEQQPPTNPVLSVSRGAGPAKEQTRGMAGPQELRSGVNSIGSRAEGGVISRLFRWLKADSDRRSAPREPGEGLTAFYWDGGVPRGHRVRDVSSQGVHVETDSTAWAAGTRMTLTLQIGSNGRPGDTAADTMVVQGEIVRKCADGIGLRFSLPDRGTRRRLLQFLSRWRSNAAPVDDLRHRGDEEAIECPPRRPVEKTAQTGTGPIVRSSNRGFRGLFSLGNSDSRPGVERVRARLRTSEQTGSSLVEFVLVLPILFALVTGICAFGLALNNYLMLTDGVAIGARLLAVSRGQTTDPCATTATAVSNASPLLYPSNISFTFVLNGTPYTGASCSSSSTTTGAAGNLVQGQPAQVTATYPCSLAVYGVNMGSGSCSVMAQTTELVQ